MRNWTPEQRQRQRELIQRWKPWEIIGWAKILKELNSKTIDKDPNPMIGELVEACGMHGVLAFRPADRVPGTLFTGHQVVVHQAGAF